MVCPSQIVHEDGISVADLSPHNGDVQEIIVLVKAYFDGGNDPNNLQYRWVTLATIYADPNSLRTFAREWREVLGKHSVEYLHTTDAVRNNQHDLLWDCASAVERNVLDNNTLSGIVPSVMTIDATAFRSARETMPEGPQIVSETLAAQALNELINGAKFLASLKGYDVKKVFYELFFDRNEPYRGHLLDRMTHTAFKASVLQVDGIDVNRYIHINAALDSRDFPELQAADLFSWTYNHRHRIRYEWQVKMLAIRSEAALIDSNAIAQPNLSTVEYINSLNLPRRAKR